jgi:sigma-B regulation protein RsbU (phosphoserine phosphatase)
MDEPRPVARILAADDQPDVLEALRLLLTDCGFEADLVSSVQGVLDRLQQQAYDLALIDLNYARDTTSGREGLELLHQLRDHDPLMPVVVMTGWGTIDTAVEAMRRGARSFVQKPWEDALLVEILNREIEEARARRRQDATMQREAEEAQLIQRSLLPTRFPDIPGLQIAAGWRPASGVGGDCFDVLAFGDGRVGLAISDVAGKGLPAALLMSNIQAAVRAFAQEETRPHVVCNSVNRLLCRNMISGRFVTFCYLRVDVGQRRVTFANAGHNPPMLLRADGGIVRLTATGIVLGVFPEATYGESEIDLAPGDRLVVYTDGITEALSPDGDEYGEDRLIAAARGFAGREARALQVALFDDVTGFARGPLQDDATLIVVLVDAV